MRILFTDEKMFGIDGAKYACHFSTFIDKDYWLLNSVDLNPMNFCVWNERIQAVKCNKVTSKNNGDYLCE